MRHCKTVLASCLVLLLPLGVGCSKKSLDLEGEANERKAELTLDLGNGVTMKLALIPAGTFMMGSAVSAEELAKQYEIKPESFADEFPQHQVTMSKPYYMAVTEVTQAQWNAVMGTEPWKAQAHVKDGDEYPANYVTWEDATAFCKALSRKAGKSVRVPTEAQWEYACRAGTTTKYYFGDDDSKLGDYAWFEKNAWDVGEKHADGVARKKPNAWGLYDMHGNVWEWCQDRYGSYANAEAQDPQGPRAGPGRVLRGGSWFNLARHCRSAYRNGATPENRNGLIGFRVVLAGRGLAD